MKKLMSTMIAVCMLLSLLSGAVLFSGSAEAYETVKLVGFSNWTQAQLDTSSGNNGYANGCGSALYVETNAAYCVGGTTQAIKAVHGGGTAYNNCIVNWKYQTGGPCTDGSVWATADGESVSASDYEGIRIAVLNSKGEPAQFTRAILRLTYAWNYSSNMRYWDGAPVSDGDGWMYFPFSEFQSSNGGGTDIYDYFDNLAKGISMLNYGSADENTCYYSGVELYRTAGEVQKGSLLSAIAKLKGYDSVTYASEISAAEAVANDSSATQTQVDGQLLIINNCIDEYISNLYTDYAYVQLTGVQDWTADDLASLTKYGSTYAISDKGLKGKATQSVEMTVKDNFNRFCLASKTSSGFLAKNPFRFMDTSKGYKLSDFDGIAIAFNDADGKPLELSQFQVRLMRGQADWDSYWSYEGNYYDTPLVYHDGYYHLYFKDYANLAGDAINEISVISALFYKVLQAGDKAYFSDICAFSTDGLEEPEVDTHDINKVKADLDGLLNEADALGFFDSNYANYEDISLADIMYADPESTYDKLFIQTRIVRMLILEETADDDLYNAFARCVNAWEYNYTAASFAKLLEAIDAAWAIYDDDAAGAIALLDAAYDALVPIETEALTANFFEGWTDTDVNDVVDANSVKLCDSIGDGLNAKDVWNAGDFSNNTAFEANNNFSMTALADFTGKAMGWKNMDRSKTLQTESNGAFPPMNVAGLSGADGIRFKLESTGPVDRILIGLSNCSSMTREDYALLLRPEFVAADGYINVPFSYFEKAWWCSEKFNKSNLDDVIVFIIECYGVEEDTTVTVSDLYGYKKLSKASADLVEKVHDAAEKLEAFDVDGRYAQLIADAKALGADSYEGQCAEAYDAIFALLKAYGVPEAAIVDVPGFSIYTQEELDKMDSLDGESSLTKTERGVIYNLPKTSGDYAFVNGIYVPGTGFDLEHNGGTHKKDPFYGKTLPINGKTFIDMLGGYKLSEIIAYRYQVENANPNKGNAIHYSDGAGLWHSMLTKKHDVKPDADNWFTYYIDETPIDPGDWYYNDFDLEKVKEQTVFAVFEIFDQRGKEMYNWQVILYESIDRSVLKEALERFAGMDVEGYDDALDVYYDKDATEAELNAAAEALVNSAKPKAPAAPELSKVTYNSVTLIPGAKNIEFRCGDGEWTSSNTFENLTPDTEYSFYARVMEIGALPASDPSEALVVRTLKAPIKGEVGIEGEAVYGKTLTAVTDGIPEGAGELTYTWSRSNALEAVEIGTGETYVIGKDDIGYNLSVAVTAANLDGSIVSENTAEVIKATPELITAPAPATVIVGEKLGTAVLTGAEVSTEGTWAWVEPDVIPDLSQSGSAFEAVFTPADPDCYLELYADVIVNVSSNTEETTITDDASGLSVTGEFLIGANPEMTVADITPVQTAYIDLLRAARYSNSVNNLILFKNVSFDKQCFAGKLTLSAQLSASKAGQEYTVWYFADGEVQNAVATVDANGVITVENFIVDIA